ncbi:MAG: class I SAM-dependent methyltransferase, partial [Chitinophagaceae bacterium]|nr:class I SAM-dependent methyltransferase [Chitinophagaceae bacterium]
MQKDLFSSQSSAYARFRPVYPDELYQYILQFVGARNRAWDVATGNGQAAVVLATFFERVDATDISAKQISEAVADPRINYAVGSAEQSAFEQESFDLITVAQAYHWLDPIAFRSEVKRVGKKESIVAVWGYHIPQSTNKELNIVINDFYKNVVGTYWDSERRFVDERYETVQFNFEELPTTDFSINVEWHAEQLIGYLNSWSSVQHFIKANGYNPI